MAKCKEVTVGLKRLVNLGNFENVTLNCEAVFVLQEGDDAKKAFAEAFDEAIAGLMSHLPTVAGKAMAPQGGSGPGREAMGLRRKKGGGMRKARP